MLTPAVKPVSIVRVMAFIEAVVGLQRYKQAAATSSGLIGRPRGDNFFNISGVCGILRHSSSYIGVLTQVGHTWLTRMPASLRSTAVRFVLEIKIVNLCGLEVRK